MIAPRTSALALIGALFVLLGLFILCCLGGCDYDRDYSASYDVDHAAYAGGVTIRPAAHPGHGEPSLSLRVTGDGKEFRP